MTLKGKNMDIFRFFQKMIQFRKMHPALRRKHFFTGLDYTGDGIPDLTWHGVKPYEPDRSYYSRSIAFMISGKDCPDPAFQDVDIYVALNQWIEPLVFELPDPPNGKNWYRVVDTYLESPDDFLDIPRKLTSPKYTVMPRSSIILIGF